MCHYSQPMEIRELLADILSQHIRTNRPEKLEFSIPNKIAYSAQLRLLLIEVQQHHEGELSLELHHSYLNYLPCDDVIEALAGAR